MAYVVQPVDSDNRCLILPQLITMKLFQVVWETKPVRLAEMTGGVTLISRHTMPLRLMLSNQRYSIEEPES